MDVRTIVADYLKEHGFDGLWDSNSGECACLLRDDSLMHCYDREGSPVPDCEAGYLQSEECAKQMGFDYALGPNRVETPTVPVLDATAQEVSR